MRPLPILPRGPRRPYRPPVDALLACPRICPQWELSALRALMKPQTRNRIEHRRAAQSWPTDARQRINVAQELIRERIGYELEPHFPIDGDYYFAALTTAHLADEARAVALLLSRQFPQTWFVFGRLYVRDGAFWRRRRGVELVLVKANDIHLSRGVRAALRDVLSIDGARCR